MNDNYIRLVVNEITITERLVRSIKILGQEKQVSLKISEI